MTRKMTCAVAAALAVLWLTGGRARADLIHWSADSSLSLPQLTTPPVPPGIGYAYGLNESSSHAGSGSLLATILHMDTGLESFTPFTFSGPASLRVSLTDKASGASGDLLFGGALRLTGDRSTVATTLTFSDPTQSVVLGGNSYTVALPPDFVLQTHFDGVVQGSLNAHVDVQPASLATAPEPSSLVLAGLGLAGLGGAAWQRWRRRATAA